jgi:hypothetical protein
MPSTSEGGLKEDSDRIVDPGTMVGEPRRELGLK